jgi:hypothetical protein
MAVWKAILRHSPSYNTVFHEQFPSVRKVLDFNLQHVFVAVGLIKSYVLLGGPAFLKTYAGEHVSELRQCLYERASE